MTLSEQDQIQLENAKLQAVKEFLDKHSEAVTSLSRIFSLLTTVQLLWGLREYSNGQSAEITDSQLAKCGVAFTPEDLQASMETIAQIIQAAEPWLPIIAKVAKI